MRTMWENSALTRPRCTWKWGSTWTNLTYESPPKQTASSLYSEVKSLWRFECGFRFATWFACDVRKAGTDDCVIGSSESRRSGLKPNSVLNSGLKIANVWSRDVTFRIKFFTTLFLNSSLAWLCFGQFIIIYQSGNWWFHSFSFQTENNLGSNILLFQLLKLYKTGKIGPYMKLSSQSDWCVLLTCS